MEGQSSTVRSATSPPLSADAAGDAYEIKFRLCTEAARWVERWAREHLSPDAHGDNGVYRTTSLYLDTPFLDIYHKTRGHRRSKYRLRRYGETEWVHLERKMRRGDRVRKRRDRIPLSEVPHLPSGENGYWFGVRVRQRAFRPICCIAYTRSAFQAETIHGPLRLTLDREVIGAPAADWTVPAHVNGRELLREEVILELKYRTNLPPLFRDLLTHLPARMAGVSKYGRCVETWELARR